MIIRKPYAFLVKNFRKIHIFLLILCLYVAYKLFNVSGFVSEFMRLGIYDVYNEPITNYITFLLILALLVIVVLSGALILLLRHKGKPWKLYLVPFVEYLALIFVLNMIKSFFGGYSSDIETTDLRLTRDLLMIFIVAQIPTISIFAMRIFGWDIHKFNFNSDQEFLELSEEDREEIEISFDIDKHSFIRTYKRLFRNIKYFYLEHKGVLSVVFIILFVIIGFNVYKVVFVQNKSYSQGDSYFANGYTIKVNDSYYTNKDGNGTVISSKNNFAVVSLVIKNQMGTRKIKIENFHLKNATDDYVTTNKIYSKEFQDLGTTYDSVMTLKQEQEVNLILVFKVSKDLNKDKFVLFYQEDGGVLRKIKLNINDVSRIIDKDELKLGDSVYFTIKNKKQEFSIDKYEFLESVDYTYRKCNALSCTSGVENFTAPEGYKIMKFEFGSNGYEGKDMIDFSNDYGRIIYINSKGKDATLRFDNPFKRTPVGKYIYTLVSDDVVNSSKLKIDFTVRNIRYTYNLK